jgi:membrane-associated phospholipid phosphatase
MPDLFYRLPRSVANIFSGRNLLWHALAIVLTMVIVMSGFDWRYYVLTRTEIYTQLARPALRLGMLVPVLGSLAVLVFGAATKNRRAITTAWALGQAALLGYLITSCYKAMTGRRPPPFHGFFRVPAPDIAALTDSSYGFRFGFLQGGIFWGWPSGHTTVAFSMASCLIALFPKSKVTVFLALLYAFYIGLGVSVTIHWFSEFVAGAIIGSVIGTVVGVGFRSKLLDVVNGGDEGANFGTERELPDPSINQ